MGLMLADGLEDAFIGVVCVSGEIAQLAVYDREKCIDILLRDGGTINDAKEYFEYNVIGTYAGEGGPLFIESMTLEEARGGVGP